MGKTQCALEWKEVRVVLIRKPGKAYHQIQSDLSVLGKGFEYMVMGRLERAMEGGEELS